MAFCAVEPLPAARAADGDLGVQYVFTISKISNLKEWRVWRITSIPHNVLPLVLALTADALKSVFTLLAAHAAIVRRP